MKLTQTAVDAMISNSTQYGDGQSLRDVTHNLGRGAKRRLIHYCVAPDGKFPERQTVAEFDGDDWELTAYGESYLNAYITDTGKTFDFKLLG